jgi:hypothetical protein
MEQTWRWWGRTTSALVTVKARLARWRCRNQRCERRIFTERRPDLAAPFARHTSRAARSTLVGVSVEVSVMPFVVKTCGVRTVGMSM